MITTIYILLSNGNHDTAQYFTKRKLARAALEALKTYFVNIPNATIEHSTKNSFAVCWANLVQYTEFRIVKRPIERATEKQ